MAIVTSYVVTTTDGNMFGVKDVSPGIYIDLDHRTAVEYKFYKPDGDIHSLFPIATVLAVQEVQE